MINCKLIAKVFTPGEEENTIGTAYPIRPGVVITALHVIPDIGNLKNTRIIWEVEVDSQSQEEEKKEGVEITKVRYSNEAADIVLLECETPADTTVVEICRRRLSSSKQWDSIGYPIVGADAEKATLIQDPATGFYMEKTCGGYQMHLKTDCLPKEKLLWQGMSGAPIFTTGTNQLTGIITHVPEDDGSGYENRIYATSMATLLEKDEDFKEKIQIDIEINKYINLHKEKLFETLKNIENSNSGLFKSLRQKFSEDNSEAGVEASIALRDKMVADYIEMPNKGVEKLWLACEPHMKGNADQCELLLLYLMASNASQDSWLGVGGAFHHFDVESRFLCELKLAARYQVSPQLKQEEAEIVGRCAIDGNCCLETGDDPKNNALSYADKAYLSIHRKMHDIDFNGTKIKPSRYKRLQEKISALRKGDGPKLYRIELNTDTESEEALNAESVRNEIHKLLPDLPIVFYGKESKDFDFEPELLGQVEVFYEKLVELG